MEPVPWEYAIMVWDGDGHDDFRIVRFSYRDAWTWINCNEYMQTLRELGDDSFGLVTFKRPRRGVREDGLWALGTTPLRRLRD